MAIGDVLGGAVGGGQGDGVVDDVTGVQVLDGGLIQGVGPRATDEYE